MVIRRPTLLIDKQRALHNIYRMKTKADRYGIQLRPHFKTHQSATVGEWFRSAGVEAITVSSVAMARYFADDGWSDITIAFPVNLREMDEINELAERITLHVLVESAETVDFLANNITHHLNAWIKIDTGSHRTGIASDRPEEIRAVAGTIANADRITLKGILTHAGHTYNARSKEEIQKIHEDSTEQMRNVRAMLSSERFSGIEISVGDTPTASVAENWDGIDEMRPGNFVFYDVIQYFIGSCGFEDIAVVVACPVVAKHGGRQEIVIYGGAVHYSKDGTVDEEGRKIFGLIADHVSDTIGPVRSGSYVRSASQEHGIVKAAKDLFNRIKQGDLLYVVPVHSCLAMNLLNDVYTLDGERVTHMRSGL